MSLLLYPNRTATLQDSLLSDIYFSIDIETDGLCPGLNSMLSLGVAAFEPKDGNLLAAFKANLLPLPDASPDPATMSWWATEPEAYQAATTDPQPPAAVMQQFEAFVKATAGSNYPCACYWKPEFDGAFIRYYSYRFLGRGIFGRTGSGLDIKTLTSAALKKPYSEVKVGEVPREWTLTGLDHNHDALDDAREQARICSNAYKVIYG